MGWGFIVGGIRGRGGGGRLAVGCSTAEFDMPAGLVCVVLSRGFFRAIPLGCVLFCAPGLTSSFIGCITAHFLIKICTNPDHWNILSRRGGRRPIGKNVVRKAATTTDTQAEARMNALMETLIQEDPESEPEPEDSVHTIPTSKPLCRK